MEIVFKKKRKPEPPKDVLVTVVDGCEVESHVSEIHLVEKVD